MNDKAITVVENALAVGGVALSLTQIEQVLGIVLLAVQIGIILTRLAIKVVHHIKSGNVEEAVKATQEAQEEIEKATKKGKNNNE